MRIANPWAKPIEGHADTWPESQAIWPPTTVAQTEAPTLPVPAEPECLCQAEVVYLALQDAWLSRGRVREIVLENAQRLLQHLAVHLDLRNEAHQPLCAWLRRARNNGPDQLGSDQTRHELWKATGAVRAKLAMAELTPAAQSHTSPAESTLGLLAQLELPGDSPAPTTKHDYEARATLIANQEVELRRPALTDGLLQKPDPESSEP